MVRKLRRENDDLRREVLELRQTSGSNGSNQNRGGRYRGNNFYKGHRFPPLHSQSYWQGGKGVEREPEGASSGTSLPSLNVNQQNNGGSQHYGGRRTSNNNHRYHPGGENRKYHGGPSKGHKS